MSCSQCVGTEKHEADCPSDHAAAERQERLTVAVERCAVELAEIAYYLRGLKEWAQR